MKLLLLTLLLALGSLISRAQPSPGSFAYLLQADSLANSKAKAVAKLAACGRDWIVLDAHYSSDEPWSVADLAAIRAGRPGRKVIAYLSIGEAEDYRAYWNPKWDADHDGKPDAGAPAWLLAQNPEWKGNYRVKYWQPGWQQIILTEVDRIMAAGFDGVYLDIVDGFETFEQDGKGFADDRVNPESKQSYRRDMVDWVKAVAARARSSNATALIIPQNGTQLLAHADFLSTVDAVGVEDLFTNGDKLQKPADTKYVLECLAPLTSAHKPVLDVEYARCPECQTMARNLSAQHGFVWIVTDRPLRTLGESGK
ncbi:MAG: endo alpha-1,4 polygalactosaminidase [Verrucomicrobiae bacterium]|nr:endo alpha-1,4 polygalactosaminidase [Verrucomicrobiae bacterium]